MRSSRAVAVAVLGVSLLLAGCGTSSKPTSAPSTTPSASAETFPTTVKVAGASTTISARPTSIVSLDPTATEDLFAIGAGSQVKVVDSLSDYPSNAPRDAKLSAYTPNVEAIAAYNPDLVVISNDMNHIAENLTKLNVTVLTLPAPTDIDGAYQEIDALGQATGHVAQADSLVTNMKKSISAELTKVKSASGTSAGLTYFYELDPTLYSATSNTFIGKVMALFGLRNIADSAKDASGGYPQLSEEAVVKAAPALVFTADSQTPAQVDKRPGWADVPAVKNGDVFELNADIASRWGPRLVDLVNAVGDDVIKASK